MSTLNHSDSPNSQLDEVLEIISRLARESAGRDYIYRGEPDCYDKVSSSLYRSLYCRYREIMDEDFDIEAVQIWILDEARNYATYTRETDELEILAELQHYEGETNLIDFTTDYLTALFFACDGVPDKDGRVILLQKSREMGNYISQPRNPTNRVIAQKSIFVRPPKGFIEQYDKVIIPHVLKQPVLYYIRTWHGISAETVYNDLHGFIRVQGLHQVAYAELYTGITRYNKRDYQQAIDHYTKALELNPQMTVAYHNRGLAHYSKDDFDLAIQDFSKALDLDSSNADNYHNRGLAYCSKDDFDLAIQDFSKALDLDSSNASTYYNRGNAYYIRGDFDHAIQDYSDALVLDPDDSDTHCNLGLAYVDRGDYDLAIQDYSKAIDLAPDDADVYYNRGVAWLFLSEWEKAESDLTAAGNMGADVKSYFRDGYGSVACFEQENNIDLPEDIAAMLT